MYHDASASDYSFLHWLEAPPSPRTVRRPPRTGRAMAINLTPLGAKRKYLRGVQRVTLL